MRMKRGKGSCMLGVARGEFAEFNLSVVVSHAIIQSDTGSLLE